jgi:hypothetical protein
MASSGHIPNAFRAPNGTRFFTGSGTGAGAVAAAGAAVTLGLVGAAAITADSLRRCFSRRSTCDLLLDELMPERNQRGLETIFRHVREQRRK